MSWIASRLCRRLLSPLFGHESTPPLWCQREWKVAADFSITCSERLSPSWHVPQWESVAPTEGKRRAAIPRPTLLMAIA